MRVQADDGNGGTFEKQLAVTVTDVNEAPTNISLSPTTGVAENEPAGRLWGRFRPPTRTRVTRSPTRW